MDAFALLVGKILPFVTIVTLVLGLLYRLRRWKKAAVANMALYPAASTSKGEMWRKVLKETFLFTTFRKEHPGLWWSTWLFHATLVLILLGHTRLITDWPLRVLFGMSEGAVSSLSLWSGGIAGVIIMVTCIALMIRRMAVQRVREISSGEDHIVMWLLLAIIITGNCLRFVEHFDVTAAQTYFAGLFTLSLGTLQVPASGMFLLHFLLVQLLLIYLPFGKLLHLPGIFFSKPLVAKDY